MVASGLAGIAVFFFLLTLAPTGVYAVENAQATFFLGLAAALGSAFVWRGGSPLVWAVLLGGAVVFLPFEALGVAAHPSVSRLVFLFVDAALVLYLAMPEARRWFGVQA